MNYKENVFFFYTHIQSLKTQHIHHLVVSNWDTGTCSGTYLQPPSCMQTLEREVCLS